jgi:uncharacterized membrane protein
VREFLAWAVLTLVLSASLVVGALWGLPYVVTGAVMFGFRRRIQSRPIWNKLLMGGPAGSGQDKVVMTSPDMIYMLGLFDVRRDPVRIHCAIPDRETYWSIALYTRWTDAFYVRNDRSSQQTEFDLVLSGPGNRYQKIGDEEVVRAPVSRGLVVIRAVLRDRDDQQEIARFREILKRTSITPLGASSYSSASGAATPTESFCESIPYERQ